MAALFIDALFDVEKKVDLYYLIGENLAQGNGFVAELGGPIVLHRAPLYPFLLAFLYRMFGETNLLSVLFIQAAFDAGTGLLIWWIGARLFGTRIGLIAALGYALYPLSAYYTLRLSTESMYTFMLLAMIASLVYAVSKEKRGAFFWAGMLMGATTLVRPVGIGLVPFLVVSLLVREFRRKSTIAPVLVYFVLGFILILIPWTVRNYTLTGHVIPVSTGGGLSLWGGNNVRFDGQDSFEMHDPGEAEAWIQERVKITEQAKDSHDGHSFIFSISYAEDQAYVRALLQEVRTRPMGVLFLLGKKFFRLWFSIFIPSNQYAQAIVYLFQGSLLLFAVYGAMRVRKNQPAAFVLLAVVIYTVLIHTMTYATLRYSIPMVPILMIFAMAGLWDAGRRIVGRFGNVNASA